MKINKANTKFEFSTEESKAIETVYSLLDSIYENMEGEEFFLDCDMYDIEYVSAFFGRFKNALNSNEGVVEMG